MKIRKMTAAFAAGLSFGLLTMTPNASAETLLERGTYLMQSVVACGNCHTPKGPDGDIPGMELAGMAPFEKTPAFDANSPNITQDMETGIGGWTDAQIIASIREGKRPDGSIIGPPMPIGLYRGMSDWDVQAIVAYLRTVKPIRNEIPKSVYRIPLPPAYGPPVGSVPSVSPDDRVAYGAYLAGPAGHCIECHSPLGEKGPDWVNRTGAGGFEFHGPWGVSVSSNITPAGLGNRSYAEIRRMITEGIRPDGSRMLPPMAYSYYANIKEEDLRAIVAYLRTLPAK
ncbi:MAG: cytochrome c [Alphaproteobacteria bacterium]